MTTPSTESYLLVRGRTEILVVGLLRRVDGYYAEQHEVRVRKTGYPVESGATLIDHAVREPYRLKLNGVVSDVNPGPNAITGVPLNQRAMHGWGALLDLINAREPFTVVTLLGSYRNMLIVRGSAPQDASTGEGLHFDLDLEEVLFATVDRQMVQVSNPPTGPASQRLATTNHGRVATETTTLDNDQVRSLATPVATPMPTPPP